MFCSQCATQLTPDDVYCPKCAKPVATFAFDSANVAQVEPWETPTVVRVDRKTPKPASKSSWALWIGVTAAIILIGSVLLALVIESFRGKQVTTVQLPPVNQNVYVTVTPVPTISPKPTPSRTPTPANVDDEGESLGPVANSANQAANGIKNRPNSNASSNRPPAFDRNGKRLRAICNDGTPSYWQGIQDLTCLTKGGVRYLYW